MTSVRRTIPLLGMMAMAASACRHRHHFTDPLGGKAVFSLPTGGKTFLLT